MLDRDQLSYVHRVQHTPIEVEAGQQSQPWETFISGLAEFGLAVDATGRLHLQGQNRFRYFNSIAKVYKSANQTIATATLTTVTFDAEAFDTDSLHDNAVNNSRITATIPGKYLVSAEVQWDTSALGTYRFGNLYINGSVAGVFGTSEPNASVGAVATSSLVIALIAGDYIELKVQHDAGVNLDLIGGLEANSSLTLMYGGEQA